jgi:hypothetical protein
MYSQWSETDIKSSSEGVLEETLMQEYAHLSFDPESDFSLHFFDWKKKETAFRHESKYDPEKRWKNAIQVLNELALEGWKLKAAYPSGESFPLVLSDDEKYDRWDITYLLEREIEKPQD